MIKASASRVPVALGVALVVMLVPATLLAQDPAPAPNDATRPDTVHVEAPTGEPGVDRARIIAALNEVRPGGVVRFAPGTYRIGEFLQVSTPRITLAGHPEGTTLRGCDPAAFGDIEVAVAACNGLALTGERQTVRGLTFEHMWQALWVGCCLELAGGENEPGTRHVGGHLVEGNTFRASVNGFRVIGDSPEPVVIRDNDFVNVWHAGGVNGRTAHILGNRISVPDAADVPPNGFPGLALFITPYDTRLDRAFTCAGNIVAGNRVEGHPEGIAILALRAGAICRDNVIRENTIRVDRVGFTGTPWGVTGIGDPADSTLVGVPIAFSDLSAQTTEIFGLPAEPGDEVLIQDNLIEGNRIVGAEGLGIEILRASGNRIVDNVITGVAVRDPFPGNTMYVPPPWGEANGSGIWVSPGSDDNEIVGNTFEDNAAFAVFVEGDSNRVELREQNDGVRNLGTGNDVVVRASAEHEMHLQSPDLKRIMDAANVGPVFQRLADSGERRRQGEAQAADTKNRSRAPVPASDTIRVAPPTGDRETDRASILAALEQVRPGGTVLFAPGTYLVGRFIDVAVPRITFAGHADGTTIRGCDPAEFEAMERDAAVVECNGFNLTGGHQAVRDLTFEHAWHTLALGDYTPGPLRAEAEQVPVESRPGGYVVEYSTFRYTQNGIRLTGQWSEPAVIRGNRFVDTYHAVVINGMTAHVIDNEISVPEPERVPHDHRPGTPLYAGGWAEVGMPACDGNIIAGNRIEGHPDGIVIAPFPGGVCRRNEIRDNTIRVERIPFTGPSTGIHLRSPSDSVLVGVPIALLNGVFGDGVIEDTRIEGNEVLGASGVAIEILGATGNRIANNLIRDVAPRDPFPGNTLFPEAPEWRDANGSGIWLSPSSDDNEIAGNRFEDVAGYAVFVEGDGNRVELTGPRDSVRDLGSGNRVDTAAAPSDAMETLPDDTRYLWLEDLDADTVLAWAESRTEHAATGGHAKGYGPEEEAMIIGFFLRHLGAD